MKSNGRRVTFGILQLKNVYRADQDSFVIFDLKVWFSVYIHIFVHHMAKLFIVGFPKEMQQIALVEMFSIHGTVNARNADHR